MHRSLSISQRVPFHAIDGGHIRVHRQGFRPTRPKLPAGMFGSPARLGQDCQHGVTQEEVQQQDT